MKPETLCHGCVKQIQAQLDDLPTIRNVLYEIYLAKFTSADLDARPVQPVGECDWPEHVGRNCIHKQNDANYDEYYDSLGGIPGSSSGQAGGGSNSKGSKPTLNVNTLDLVDEIDDVIDRTAGLDVVDLIRQPAVQFKLWQGGKWRMDYLDGVQRALEIRKVWKRADEVIGMSRPWQQRHAPCPNCNVRALGNFAGSDAIQCSHCGHAMTLDDYSELIITVNKKK